MSHARQQTQEFYHLLMKLLIKVLCENGFDATATQAKKKEEEKVRQNLNIFNRQY